MVHQLNEELVKNYQKIMVSCGLVLEELASDPFNNIVLPGTRQSKRRYHSNRVNKTGSYSLVNKNRSKVLPVPPIVSLDASINQFQNVLDLMFVELEDSIDFLKAEEKRLSSVSMDVDIPENSATEAVKIEKDKDSLKDATEDSEAIVQENDRESSKPPASNNESKNGNSNTSSLGEIKVEKDSNGGISEPNTVTPVVATDSISLIDNGSSSKENKEKITDEANKEQGKAEDKIETHPDDDKHSPKQEVKDDTENNTTNHLSDAFDMLSRQENSKIGTPSENNTNNSLSDETIMKAEQSGTDTGDKNNDTVGSNNNEKSKDNGESSKNNDESSKNNDESNTKNNNNDANGHIMDQFDINNFGGQDLELSNQKNDLINNSKTADPTMDFDGLNFDFSTEQNFNMDGNENNETGKDINNLLDMLQGIIQEKSDS